MHCLALYWPAQSAFSPSILATKTWFDAVGATETYNASDEDCVQKIIEATSGGVDFAFETAGAIGAMQTCYDILRTGGRVVAGLTAHPIIVLV